MGMESDRSNIGNRLLMKVLDTWPDQEISDVAKHHIIKVRGEQFIICLLTNSYCGGVNGGKTKKSLLTVVW